MATVAQVRSALNDLMRYGSDNFSDTQRDHAIYWALEQACKASGMLRTIGSITIAEDDLTVTHGLSRFQPGRLYGSMYISTSNAYTRVVGRALGDLQAKLDESVTTGTPEMIHFISQTQCMIYPISDGDYTIQVPYEQTAPSWTWGDAGATSLELPDHLVYGGMLFGAKAYIMSGLEDGRAEEDRATARFNEWLDDIRDADTHLAPSTNPRNALYTQTHTPLPGV